ncbi:SnoaL-like domain-containing protein [Kribbella sandramycini]|uniref:SnoaL-like domain-containing protein n=1 Tax=Kribbella sandramycini TaxID=60450 RepID=A0A7Y4P124_9ACTN|nr:nuclear transport factor 2 family protein [Kribbella sandramycini]NOL42498.1 SnoaL-like domain-containing protein [Kribbella sandramycini]
MLQHVGAGETDAAAALFADDVDFFIPRAAELPWVPDVDSAAGMATYFGLLRTHLDGKRFDVERIVADATDAVVIGQLVSTVRATGRDIESRFAIHVGTRDGRITRYHFYEDSLAVAQALVP